MKLTDDDDPTKTFEVLVEDDAIDYVTLAQIRTMKRKGQRVDPHDEEARALFRKEFGVAIRAVRVEKEDKPEKSVARAAKNGHSEETQQLSIRDMPTALMRKINVARIEEGKSLRDITIEAYESWLRSRK